jgi:ABC-2 type transport system permease protein
MTGTSQLTGASQLTRLAARRDRIMLPAWIYVLTAIAASGAYALRGLYPTAASRTELAASVGSNPALSFLYGQLHGTSQGAVMTWRYGTFGAVGAGLMTIFLVVRHTRGDEEAGRLELVDSAAVSRQAGLAAGLLIAGVASVAVAVLTFAALLLSGLPATGSLAFAAATAQAGLVFGAVAAVAAQLSGTARGARGIAFGVLGAAYLLRAIGDSAGTSGLAWLSWLSPVGWPGELRPYGGDRWWVLALPLATVLAVAGAAVALSGRRDVGSGLLPARPGSPRAGALLRGPLGLAWRLQRGTLAGWAFGFLVVCGASGAAAKGIGGLLDTSHQLRQVFEKLGGQAGITNAYLAAVMSLAGLAAGAYATSAVLRLRGEETALRADPLIAGPVGRIRWAAGHLAITVAGTAVVLVAGGVGAGLAYGLRIGDVPGELPAMIGAALAQIPAALAVAGVAVLLTGLVPRWSVAGGWLAAGVAALIALFGPALSLSQWVLDISPFSQVPRLPGSAVSATPLIWMAGVAVLLAVAGLAGLRRRDLG